MLAKVAAHYGLGKVVAIDPHNFNLSEKTRGGQTHQRGRHRPKMIF
jgi:hypothetical protein